MFPHISKHYRTQFRQRLTPAVSRPTLNVTFDIVWHFSAMCWVECGRAHMLFVTCWSSRGPCLCYGLKDKSPLQILGRTNGTRACPHPYHPSAGGSRPFSLPRSSSHPHSIRHCRRNSSSVSKSLVPDRSKCLFVLCHISVHHRIPALLLLLSFLLFFTHLRVKHFQLGFTHIYWSAKVFFCFFFHCVLFCMTVVYMNMFSLNCWMTESSFVSFLWE